MRSKTQYLTTEEAARFLGRSPATLDTWRCRKRYGLPYIKNGGRIEYDLDDLIAWRESRKVRPVEATAR
jgi:hypothetical protein